MKHLKVGQQEQTWEERKGSELRLATGTALQLEAHSWLSPDGWKSAVAGTSFSLKERRDLLSTPAGVSSANCGLAERPGQGHSTEVLLWLLGGWHPDKERKSQNPAAP